MICWGYSAFQCAWLWCNFKFLVFQVPWCPYLCEVHRSISCDIQVMFNMHRLNWVNKFRTGVYNYINSFILQSYQTPIVKHRLRGNQTVSILDVLPRSRFHTRLLYLHYFYLPLLQLLPCLPLLLKFMTSLFWNYVCAHTLLSVWHCSCVSPVYM